MNFTVICNGCDVIPKGISNKDIRAELGISEDDFLFVFVGNINPNKNQVQVIDALKILKSKGCENIKCLFIGGGDVQELTNKVQSLDLSSQAIVIGFVEKDCLPSFYNAADATILTSLSEGFGLSIIEGFVYGKPNLTFSDLPAVADLYNVNTILLCPSNDTNELAKYMLEMSSKIWDSSFIKSYASNFSLETMADNYIDFYKNIIANI